MRETWNRQPRPGDNTAHPCDRVNLALLQIQSVEQPQHRLPLDHISFSDQPRYGTLEVFEPRKAAHRYGSVHVHPQQLVAHSCLVGLPKHPGTIGSGRSNRTRPQTLTMLEASSRPMVTIEPTGRKTFPVSKTPRKTSSLPASMPARARDTLPQLWAKEVRGSQRGSPPKT